jgi:hypothetical protein
MVHLCLSIEKKEKKKEKEKASLPLVFWTLVPHAWVVWDY